MQILQQALTFQVCPPGLHLSLGIFLKLFNQLEVACKKLDMRAHLVGVGAGATYERYEEAYTEQNSLKEKVEQEKIIIRNLEQAGLLLTLTLPNPATNPVCSQMNTLVGQKKADLQRLVRNVYITQKFRSNFTLMI